MAEQRPLLPLLVTFYQTAMDRPLGAQAREFEAALADEAQNTQSSPVPRPTMVVALRQAVDLGVLRAEGEKRGRKYFAGSENPGTWTDTILAQKLDALNAERDDMESAKTSNVHPNPKASSGQTKSSKKASSMTQTSSKPPKKTGKAAREATPSAPLPLQAQQFKKLQAVVWGIADTLRDQSNLQVDGYRPVTLVLMALKRNLDTQARMQLPGGWVADLLQKNGPMLDSGILTGVDFAAQINQRTEIFDPAIFAASHPFHGKASAPLMTWKDLQVFRGNPNRQPHDPPETIRLLANPDGKSWFTYATEATDLKGLIEDLVKVHVADLREAFGAIGLHAALVPGDPNAPRLSEAVLRTLVDQVAEVDFSLEAIPSDVFSDVYMDLLGRFAADSGKKGGDFFTPTPLVQGALRFLPLSRMVRDLVDAPQRRITIADPTAGAFTFLTQAYDAMQREAVAATGMPLDRRQFIFHAQELTAIQAGLGVFNFFFHGLASRLAPIGAVEEANGRPLSAGGAIARIVGNSISDYLAKIGHQAGQVDLILANPPYGTADYGLEYAKGADPRKDGRWHAGMPTRSEGEWSFVNTVVDLLSPTGKAAIVLPLGVLFRDGGKAFRQFLIEKNWIEGVVALPANQFLTTQIPVCLLLLNKDTGPNALGFDGQPRRHGVFIVNASGDFTKTGKFNHWDQDAAVEAWNTRTEIAGYSGFVPVEKLRDERNNYNLSVNRYFAPIKDIVDRDPVALAANVVAIRERLSKRAEWFDGSSASGPGLWQQAVMANQETTLSQEDDKTRSGA